MKQKPIRILLVDDDEVDREAIERGFREKQLPVDITVARNGVEALAVLRGTKQGPPLPRPYIILLDLNMPQMDGFTFLDQLRADRLLKDSVVFVFTTSTRDADKAAAYSKNVAGYVSKAALGDDCNDFVRMITHYWRVIELPE